MSAGWQVGDLALCVDGSPCRNYPYAGAPFGIPAGAVARVIGINAPQLSICGGLVLEGFFATAHAWGFGFAAERFRKIAPDQQEPCEAEFVTLLKRSRKVVSA